MAIQDPIKFLRSVRAEARKVTWPSRKQTVMLTVTVLVMMVIVSLFFLGIDQLSALVIKLLFGVSR